MNQSYSFVQAAAVLLQAPLSLVRWLVSGLVSNLLSSVGCWSMKQKLLVNVIAIGDEEYPENVLFHTEYLGRVVPQGSAHSSHTTDIVPMHGYVPLHIST